MNDKERKEYASRIVNNPLWIEVMQATKDDIYREMVNADLTDVPRIQGLAASAQWLDYIQSYLQRALSAEKVTQFNLEQRKKVI